MAEHSHSSQDTPTKDRPAPRAGKSDFPIIQAGRYKLIEIVGSGGAGTVYKALDIALDKPVALKKLHNSASQSQAIRFQREARLVGALRHENLMSALDFGVTDNNEPYLILDYVDGESLGKLLKRTGPLPLNEALEIFIQAAKGLAHAHKNNILHRDIKPSNVMLVYEKDREGQTVCMAKIVDFGLAKDVRDEQNLTITGASFGTPVYMSPEQSRGREVDKRSDIYSFGCLMYEVLTGRPPFRGENPIETANLHDTEAVPAMSGLGIDCSETMEAIVSKCLGKNPKERYQTFEGLLTDLRQEWQAVHDAEAARAKEESETHAGSDESGESHASAKRKWSIIVACILVSVMVPIVCVIVYQTITQTQESNTTAKPSTKNSKTAITNEVRSVMQDAFIMVGTEGRRHLDVDPNKNYYVVDAGDKALAAWIRNDDPRVDQLVIDDAKLTAKGLKPFESRRLKAFVITHFPVNKENMSRIARLNTLQALGIGDTNTLDFQSLSYLRQLRRLDTLEITSVKLDVTAFQEISKLNQLVNLNLRACTGITSEGIKCLRSMEHLKVLKLAESDVSDESLAPIVGSKSIRDLFLRNTQVSNKLLKTLTSWRYLQLLDVSETRITKPAVVQFRKESANPTVKVDISEKRSVPPIQME